MRCSLRRLGCLVVAVGWALAVVVCPAAASWAADEPTPPAGEPTTRATGATGAPGADSTAPAAPEATVTVTAEPTAPAYGSPEAPATVQLAETDESVFVALLAAAGFAVALLAALLIVEIGGRG